MKLVKIFIDNFKAYRNFELHAHQNLNVITGTNNSGKTTILEAIALWYECFGLLIRKAIRSSSSANFNAGDYRLGKKSQNYFDYRIINSVRSFNFHDIFYELNTTQEIEIGITLRSNEGQENEIAFLIRGASGNSNYEIKLKNHDEFDFRWLNDSFEHLPDPIGCFFASPVSAVPVSEEFALRPMIQSKVTSRQSFVYIRNRIYMLSITDKFEEFKDKVSYILSQRTKSVSFLIEGDKNKEVYITVKIRIGNELVAKEISLLGSGTLQIIELLLTCYEETKDLNVILLDEPDSHIHRDIQKRLIETLEGHSSSIQVFLTTHNESLIRATHPESIYYIDDSICTTELKQCRPISSVPLPNRQKGISHSYHSQVINRMGSESSLDLLNALEAKKIILVEGVDDSIYIQSLLNTYNNNTNCVYWSFKGLDSLIKEIKSYRSFLSGIGCSEPLWDRVILVFDSDFITMEQRELLKIELTNKLQIKTHIWSSYTFESTILTDLSIYKKIIYRLSILYGLNCEQDFVSNSVDLVYEKWVGKIKLKFDTDDSYKESITRQIQNRASSLKDSLDIKNVFKKGDAMYFQCYQSYATKELADNKIAHLCNKTDIDNITKEVFVELGLTLLCIDNLFLDTITSISPDDLHPEWTALDALVKS